MGGGGGGGGVGEKGGVREGWRGGEGEVRRGGVGEGVLVSWVYGVVVAGVEEVIEGGFFAGGGEVGGEEEGVAVRAVESVHGDEVGAVRVGCGVREDWRRGPVGLTGYHGSGGSAGAGTALGERRGDGR